MKNPVGIFGKYNAEKGLQTEKLCCKVQTAYAEGYNPIGRSDRVAEGDGFENR
jgi:hypothetical protein